MVQTWILYVINSSMALGKSFIASLNLSFFFCKKQDSFYCLHIEMISGDVVNTNLVHRMY